MKFKAIFSIICSIGCVLCVACTESKQQSTLDPPPQPKPKVDRPAITATPHEKTETQGKGVMFRKLDDHGIEFINRLSYENEIPYLTNGSGVAVGDIDNDGLVDVFLCGLEIGNRLYRQKEPFQFEDITDAAGISSFAEVFSAGVTMADVNNDGFLDIYVCNYKQENELYVNQGDSTFQEQASQWNLDLEDPTTMASFVDYDMDGDLDVYLVNNRRYKAEYDDYQGRVGRTMDGKIVAHPDLFVEVAGQLVRSGHQDLLMRNEGDRFKDVTLRSGIDGYGMGLSASWFDFNSDNLPDLWVCNDLKTPDHLYVNQGNGSFIDILPEIASYTTWNSMGSDFGDFNNDGHFDLFVADMSATSHFKEKVNMGDMSTEAWFLESAEPRQIMRNCLYLNSGRGSFFETAFFSGVARTDWTWSVKCADFDGDGFQDIYVTNGMVDNSNDADYGLKVSKLVDAGQIEEANEIRPPKLIEENLAFRNVDGLTFENVSEQWGINEEGISHGAALADFDNDGDLDLIVQNYGSNTSIYRNESSGNHVTVSLIGEEANYFGIGAVVTLRTLEGMQKRMLTLARGYMSSDQPILHFGVGDAETIEKIVVQWPSGNVQEFTDLEANHHFTIAEKSNPQIESSPESAADDVATQFVKTETILDVQHNEFPYNDFRNQLLLPNKLSTLGPGMAWADFNQDGYEDVFLGAASKYSSSLLAGQEDGSFEEISGPWAEHLLSEDMGVAWLDADSDGDLDLYVASGSNEFKPADENLRDRIYFNEGNGKFVDRTHEWLPDIRESSSVVAVGDLDGDLDMDLFVGSRMVPEQYPKFSSSSILRNNGNGFEDCTSEVAPHLESVGLVTDGVWTDIDNDGQTDLVLVSEWGPITLLKNEKGRLVDFGSETSLAGVHGWWNGIAAADIDGNGFVDFVVTNFGLNTKYGQPTIKKPRKLFYGDLNGNGRIDLVEAKVTSDSGLLPVRGRSCSCAQVPTLVEKFPSYHEFAAAGLSEIYELEKTHELFCNELQSIVVLNNGNGEFSIRALPEIAQLAPSFGAAIADFDLDGSLDLFLAQNFYGPQIETGRMSGGLGAFLRGNGDGSFETTWPIESGVEIPGDARATSITDLNNDSIPDVVVALNSAKPDCFLNQGKDDRIGIKVLLHGPIGNPSGIGAKVSLLVENSLVQSQTHWDKNGYLAQNDVALYFSAPASCESIRVRVDWPDQQATETIIEPSESSATVHCRYAATDDSDKN